MSITESKPVLYTSLIGSGDWEWTGGEASTGAFVGRITPGRQSLALITATLGPLT